MERRKRAIEKEEVRKRMKKADNNDKEDAAAAAAAVATEEEVEEFFAIVTRMQAAVKYFGKAGNSNGGATGDNQIQSGWRAALESTEEVAELAAEGVEDVSERQEEVAAEAMVVVDLNEEPEDQLST